MRTRTAFAGFLLVASVSGPEMSAYSDAQIIAMEQACMPERLREKCVDVTPMSAAFQGLHICEHGHIPQFKPGFEHCVDVRAEMWKRADQKATERQQIDKAQREKDTEHQQNLGDWTKRMLGK